MTQTNRPRRLFALLLILALVACAAPRPAPAPQPRSKVLHTPQNAGQKGWQKPYVVDGQRYDPLGSHHGFTEEGIASWYGSDFHGKRTSNGEIYDMHAMTAAHKTLPMGVYVRVVNKANGREEVVRINDRGPFVRGRVIDLSYTAAKKLGVDGPGTAPVRIEALGYLEGGGAGRPTYKAPASYDTGVFAVQVGAFTVAENARRLAADMQRSFGASNVQEAMVNGTRFFRVRVGRYVSLTAAEAALAGFERGGYPSSFVVALD